MKTPLITVIFCSLFLSACAENNDSVADITTVEKAGTTSTLEAGKEQAASSVDAAKEKTAEVMDAAKEKTAEAVAATKEMAAEGIEKAKETIGDGSAVKEMIDENKDKLTSKLGM